MSLVYSYSKIHYENLKNAHDFLTVSAKKITLNSVLFNGKLLAWKKIKYKVIRMALFYVQTTGHPWNLVEVQHSINFLPHGIPPPDTDILIPHCM